MTSLATWVKLAPIWSYACRVDAYDGSTRPSGQPDPQAELLQRGVDQHQGPHQIGPESGEVDRDHRAHAVADDDTGSPPTAFMTSTSSSDHTAGTQRERLALRP
ncbi:hypothetical protein Psuf_004570 [Phytohabitans suffuscus]|uniref:Uncharacterized protein n=1 Tax=Phytohabitans suffuscus TaxID=624315 RepID=A0A6F8YAI6_9ACTN|nr:hypothetical protein Psuf_004570 [Phytohabitans suffuscus]